MTSTTLPIKRQAPKYMHQLSTIPANVPASAKTVEQIYATWPQQFQRKLTTAEEALRLVKSGERVYIGGGCGEPLVLAQHLANRWEELRGVEIVHILTAGHAAYLAPGMEESFHVNSLF